MLSKIILFPTQEREIQFNQKVQVAIIESQVVKDL